MAEPSTKLSWDDFRLVKAIADASGMTGAAAALGLHHSTVFRRLEQIERTLGTALFERHRTGYAPTAAGEEMAAVAGRLDSDITDFGRRIAGRSVSPKGELRITTNHTLLIHLLTPIFAAFRLACPEVRLDVVVSDQALNLSRRDADVAIRATERAPPDTLVGRRVARMAWALYGRRSDVRDTAVSDRNWVTLGESASGPKAMRSILETISPDRLVYRVDTVLGLTDAVEAGIGIGHLPCFIADARPGLVRLAEPDPAFAAELWLLTHQDLRHAARVRAFLDFAAAAIAKQRRALEGAAPTASE